ncbi:MAG: hypothetical protein WC876_07590 [Candidatus Thermoplasmatota archaeon]|jgi:hypothetical protein
MDRSANPPAIPQTDAFAIADRPHVLSDADAALVAEFIAKHHNNGPRWSELHRVRIADIQFEPETGAATVPALAPLFAEA